MGQVGLPARIGLPKWVRDEAPARIAVTPIDYQRDCSLCEFDSPMAEFTVRVYGLDGTWKLTYWTCSIHARLSEDCFSR